MIKHGTSTLWTIDTALSTPFMDMSIAQWRVFLKEMCCNKDKVRGRNCFIIYIYFISSWSAFLQRPVQHLSPLWTLAIRDEDSSSVLAWPLCTLSLKSVASSALGSYCWVLVDSQRTRGNGNNLCCFGEPLGSSWPRTLGEVWCIWHLELCLISLVILRNW